MSFNVEELKKIERATEGLFCSKARRSIAESLARLVPNILLADAQASDARRSTLTWLVNEYTSLRHKALSNGARSYKDPEWSAVAACESWLQGLLLDTDIAIAEINTIVVRLVSRAHAPRIRKASAALAARSLAWDYFKSDESMAEFIRRATAHLSEEITKAGDDENATVEDRALILLQALHFIRHHKDAIRQHITAMESYREPAERGIHLNFGGNIAAYITDTPYLKTYRK